MKKRMILAALTCAMAMMLVSCGSKENNEDTASASVEQQTNEEDGTTSEQLNQETKEDAGDEVTSENATNEESASDEDSKLLSVVGVYYGDIYATLAERNYSAKKLDGYKDCIVVFDYVNDSTNRRMPESKYDLIKDRVYNTDFTNPAVTLLVDGNNEYEAFDLYSEYRHYINSIVRYTPYEYPIGYGNLLGNADPVRMFAVFYVNPNELKDGMPARLTIDDQSVAFEFSDIKEIAYADEILTGESDYETQQQIAAFKWRMDKLIELAEFVDGQKPGSEMSGISKSIVNLLSPDYGVTVAGNVRSGFSKDYLYDGVTSELPGFDLNQLVTALPDQAETITALIDAANRFGTTIQNPSATRNDVEMISRDMIEQYTELINDFGMDAYKRR